MSVHESNHGRHHDDHQQHHDDSHHKHHDDDHHRHHSHQKHHDDGHHTHHSHHKNHDDGHHNKPHDDYHYHHLGHEKHHWFPHLRRHSNRDHDRHRGSSSSSSDSDHDPTTHEWKEDFNHLMRSKKGRKEFYKYLKREEKMHAIAQFKFMKACRDYRKEKDEEDRKEEAQKIYKKYIESKSEEDRIPGMQGERLEHIKNNLGDPDVFREAEEYTMKYLKEEYYAHFIESGHYNSILHAFFAYNATKTLDPTV